MGHRDAGVGGHRDRGAHARHHLEGDAGLRQRQGFLAATAEHEGIAALEPDHAASPARVLDQPRVDLDLGQAVAAGALAREEPERAGRRLVEQGRVDEAIVDDHVGPAQGIEPAHRHEPGIARARADEVDAPPVHQASIRPTRDSAPAEHAPAGSACRR